MSLALQYREGEQTTASAGLDILYPLLGEEVVDKQSDTMVVFCTSAQTLPFPGQNTYILSTL